MRIGIVGTGNVGSTLGRQFAARGHQVLYGSRDPRGERIRSLLEGHPGTASAVRPDALAAKVELLVLAIPYAALEETVDALGPLEGKILVDAINPLLPDLSGLVPSETSCGERVAALAPGALVVKAFNTIGVGVMGDPIVGGLPAVLTVAADDEDAKRAVMELGESIGFEAIDFGPLGNARYAESMAMGWIYLALKGGLGPGFAFTLSRR